MNLRIKRIRDEQHMTLTEFSDRIGISVSGLRKLESGENNPSEQTIRAICEKFGINRQWLETGDESIQPYMREPDLKTEIRKLLRNEPPIKQAVMISLVSMPDEWWNSFAEKLYKEIEQSRIKELHRKNTEQQNSR